MNKLFLLYPILFSKFGIFGKCIGDKGGKKVFEKINKNGEKIMTTICKKTGEIVKTIHFSPQQEMSMIFDSSCHGPGREIGVMDYRNGIKKEIKRLNYGNKKSCSETVARIMQSGTLLGTKSIKRSGKRLSNDVFFALGNMHKCTEYEIKEGKVKHGLTIPSSANMLLFRYDISPTVTRL